MAQNTDLLPVLLARREDFLGFLTARLNDNHADAEDILQHGLAKALAAAPPSATTNASSRGSTNSCATR